MTNPHSLQQCHVQVYNSTLRLHIRTWSRNLELYTCTYYCCKECGVVILSYIHVHAIVVKNVESGMYLYIAQDYDSTFFTTMACTCIKLKITTPHSSQQWYVHVYSSRLRLHILCNHVHTIVVKNVES
jgi:hypothetical protein